MRLEDMAKAEKKGAAGAAALFAQLRKADFRESQFEELTQQRNLYGRIDRMVTFGSNTAGGWEPRMKAESRELAKLLKADENNTNKQKITEQFNADYQKMLTLQKKHLKAMEGKLDLQIEKTLKELID